VPRKPAAVVTTSLREQVYELLKQRLGDGTLTPGTVLDQDALVRDLGISRTPLREALLQLSNEGFVTILPRRGIVVNELSLDDIRHIYEVIGALESAAVVAVGARIGVVGVRRMTTLNKEMRAALRADDFARYYEHNLEFHDVYLTRSDNLTLRRTVATLKARLYDFPRRQGFVKEWEVASTGEHAAIVEWLAAGDIAGAAAYIRDVHWSFAVQERFIHRYYFASHRGGAKERT
jgi:DNA-binding GntR family transcriptional regulator